MWEEKGDEVIFIVMLVLVGFVERVKWVGYNEILSGNIVKMIYNRYRNRLIIYYLDSEEYEMNLWDYIWVFGNFGYYFGFFIILEYIDYDNLGIWLVVILVMCKFFFEYIN